MNQIDMYVYMINEDLYITLYLFLVSKFNILFLGVKFQDSFLWFVTL